MDVQEDKVVVPTGPFESDPVIYRMIVGFMGCTLLLCLGGVLVLSAIGKEVPTTLGTLAGTLVGALSTMLYTSASTKVTRNGGDSRKRIMVP